MHTSSSSCTPAGYSAGSWGVCGCSGTQTKTDSCGQTTTQSCTPPNTGSTPGTCTGPCGTNQGSQSLVNSCGVVIGSQSCTASQCPVVCQSYTLGACTGPCGTNAGTQSMTWSGPAGCTQLGGSAGTQACTASQCPAAACGSGNALNCAPSCAVGSPSVTFCGGGSSQSPYALGWTCTSGSSVVSCSAQQREKS